MITTIRITNTEEAKTAIAMIEAYLAATGNDGVKTTPKAEPKAEPVTEEKKPEEKKPAAKKKAPAKKPEPKKEEAEEESGEELDVAALTQMAKDAVARTGDRGAVKDVVNKYSAKISTVDEADYEALANDLKAL